jgi:hypothetical protein
MFCLKEGIVRPTSERINKLLLGIENILKMESQATVRDCLHLLIIMVFCIELIPNARLFMRPIQLATTEHTFVKIRGAAVGPKQRTRNW